MVNMLKYKSSNKDAVGTTAGSLETIGTITTSADATDVVGFILQAVSTGTMTTAEALSGKYNVNAKSLAPDVLEMQIARGIGGSPATNEGELADYGLFFPFRPTSKDVANKGIEFKYDALTPEPTSEMCAQATVMFTEGNIGRDGYSHLLNNGLGWNALRTPISWSDVAHDDEIGDATSEEFDESITVPGWVNKLCAIGIQVNADAVPTAGEHLIGYIELSGSLPNIYPMQIPFPASWATLGTTVNMSQQGIMRVFPLYIEIPNADVEIKFTAVIESTTTGANQMAVTLFGY